MDYSASPSTPTSSGPSSPVISVIGWPGSPSYSSSSSSSTSSTSSKSLYSSATTAMSFASTITDPICAPCAYPSWPSGSSLYNQSSKKSFSTGGFHNIPSSHISDLDLFLDDLADEDAVPFLEEAPAPPRMYPAVAMPMPLLPLHAPEKSKKRRRSSKKARAMKQMTPIAESPLAPSE